MIVKFGLYKINLTELTDKVTENYTGKELDDETELGYWGARYLDLMLGMWLSTDPERFFSSPYLYMGNRYNPTRYDDLIGKRPGEHFSTPNEAAYDCLKFYNNFLRCKCHFRTHIMILKGKFYFLVISEND